MLQVPVQRPVGEFKLRDQHRPQPAALFHFLPCESSPQGTLFVSG